VIVKNQSRYSGDCAALERERGAIESELLLALIVTAADAYQRNQPRRITRERLHMPVASEPSAAQVK
jgi:hypothetical protein